MFYIFLLLEKLVLIVKQILSAELGSLAKTVVDIEPVDAIKLGFANPTITNLPDHTIKEVVS